MERSVTDMHGRFTVVEVRDPHLIGQTVWNSLPPSEKASITDERMLKCVPQPSVTRRAYIPPTLA